MPRGKVLSVNIEYEELVIRIGVDALKNLSEAHLSPDDNILEVADADGWAREIGELINKPDPGNDLKTPVEVMLEEAIEEAASYGNEWLKVNEDD